MISSFLLVDFVLHFFPVLVDLQNFPLAGEYLREEAMSSASFLLFCASLPESMARRLVSIFRA